MRRSHREFANGLRRVDARRRRLRDVADLLAAQGDLEDLKVGARVRWVRQLEPLWMAGLAFEQMSDARYAHLLNHLHIIEAWQLGDARTEVPATKVRFTVKE